MPAAPIGVFTIGTTKYLWHGNAVIRDKGDNERLWHGPYLQKLITAYNKEKKENRQRMQKILDALEKDHDITKTKMEGPGAYPGGGDALHPIEFRIPHEPAKSKTTK